MVKETTVDGVPTFVPGKPGSGSLRACLMFRVGRADETLATAGITHLVEHLALSRVGRQTYEWNGMVDATYTAFVVAGTPAEVVSHLGLVCASLSDLPLDRLEAERRVLTTEERRHSSTPLSFDLFMRYGAQGFGLLDMVELGLRRLDADDVATWAARHFTRGNAALWLSGRVPRGLRLDLPAGEPPPAPRAEVVFPGLPACVPADLRGATLSVEAEAGSGTSVGMRILADRALHHLRHDLAISYATEMAGIELGPKRGLLQVWSDATAEHSHAVRDGLAATAVELIEHGPTAEEVAHDLARAERAWAEEDAVLGWLSRSVTQRLWGAEVRPPEEVIEEWRALTVAQVGHGWAMAAETSMMLAGCDLPELEHWPYVPDWCTAIEEGTELHPAPGSEAEGILRVGPQGLTWLPHPKRPVAVRFDDLAVVQCWENGDRLLIASSGHRIAVIPSNWWGGGDLPAYIDGLTPDHLAVDMGAGPDRSAPPPPPPAPAPPPAQPPPPVRVQGRRRR